MYKFALLTLFTGSGNNICTAVRLIELYAHRRWVPVWEIKRGSLINCTYLISALPISHHRTTLWILDELTCRLAAVVLVGSEVSCALEHGAANIMIILWVYNQKAMKKCCFQNGQINKWINVEKKKKFNNKLAMFLQVRKTCGSKLFRVCWHVWSCTNTKDWRSSRMTLKRPS